MGLDMWLKRVRKLEEKEASEINGKRVSEANEKGYSTVRAERANALPITSGID